MITYKYEIFTRDIEMNINNGIYKPGYRLPSVRQIKEQYALSISTVQSGFEHLMIRGLVESIPKSGYYVAYSAEVPKVNNFIQPFVRDATFAHHLHLTSSIRNEEKLTEFNATAPGDLMMPQKLILRTMQQVIREKGASLLRYYPSHGSAELRDNIIGRAATFQNIIRPEELLVTDGALQGLYIALASICEPGDVIAVESPCVFSALEVIRVLRLKVIEIPVDLQTGFDISFFKRACENVKIKAAIITANFHNPTGLLLSDEQKRALVSIAHQYNVALLENDIYGDLNFQGNRPSTFKTFDDSGLVLTYSSVAKTLSPGIRLGWLAAGKFSHRAEQIRFALGRSVSPLNQEIINRLIKGGSYDRHLRRFKMQLAKNAQFIKHTIAAYFPKETYITTPAGGYSIWVKMPDGTDMSNFYDQCKQMGIRFTPGFTFSFSDSYNNYFRVVIANTISAKKISLIKHIGEKFL